MIFSQVAISAQQSLFLQKVVWPRSMYPHHLESKDLVIIFKSFHEPCQVAGMMTCWGDKILLRHLLKAKEVAVLHCKYISRNYYYNSSCPYSHRNLVVICTVNGSNLDYSPLTAISPFWRPQFFWFFWLQIILP